MSLLRVERALPSQPGAQGRTGEEHLDTDRGQFAALRRAQDLFNSHDSETDLGILIRNYGTRRGHVMFGSSLRGGATSDCTSFACEHDPA